VSNIWIKKTHDSIVYHLPELYQNGPRCPPHDHEEEEKRENIAVVIPDRRLRRRNIFEFPSASINI
jgi:hypothetical protein